MAAELLFTTRGVCPVCRRLLAASVLRLGPEIRLERDCPAHGRAVSLLSSDADFYLKSLRTIKPGTEPLAFSTEVREGCPADCGLCPSHEQHTCMPIIEITEKCDLDCPVCLVDAGRGRRDGRDLGLAEVGHILDTLVRAEGTLELINLSGGEPTLHPEIRDIVGLCGRPEIVRTSISTNGLRLAEDDALLDFLVDHNVLVSLQFDGFSGDVLRRLRGADILPAKEKLLEKMEKRQAPLSLVVTVAKGVNEGEIGRILDYFFGHDHVVSLMFQPLSRTGRREGPPFDPLDRLTVPDVIRIVAEASGGRLERSDFTPLPCSHPACFALTYLLRLEDGRLVPLPRLVSVETCLDIIRNRSLPGLDSGSFARIKDGVYEIWSSSGAAPDSKKVLSAIRAMMREIADAGPEFSARAALAVGERRVKSIFIHHFMDEDNFDLARSVRCCSHYPLPDGRLMPACTYNVLHRPRPDGSRTSAPPEEA
jgi:7,8-dihydro-6-hydroxymethylpterin dimethyltransferase